MKLLVLILAVSAVLNTALVATFISKPALAPAAVREYFRPDTGRASATAAVETNKPSVAKSTAAATPKSTAAAGLAAILAHIQTEDLSSLVGRLRAAGFPATMIRAVVEAEIQRRFEPRLEELRRSIADTPYWRGDPSGMMGTSKIYEQMNQLSRERFKMMRDILGQEAFAHAGVDPTEAQRRQFGNLSPGKIDLVRRITEDYAEMTSQIRAAMQGIALPEDREKLALLEREKRADLAGVLTPEELADYEMRTSPVTNRLRTALTLMDASEAEFRKIYAAHLPHADVLYPTNPSGGIIFSSSDSSNPRQVATQKILEDLRQSLGPDRFAQYQRSTDREFQQLYQLTRAENVPYDTLVRAYDMRQTAAETSQKIAADPALNVEQKREALKNLAQQSKTQLLSTLGPGAGPTYSETARWLSGLEQGRAFAITPDGGISQRPITMPRPATQATPPTK